MSGAGRRVARVGLVLAIALAAGGAGADESLPNAPAGSKKPRVTIEGDHLVLSEPIYFDTGKATIKAVSFALLDEIAAALKTNWRIELLEVQVHTDARGSDEYNLRMSGERATAVRAYLVEHGIAAGRLQARGYGETRPVCSEPTEPCQKRNRRTELVILRRALDE